MTDKLVPNDSRVKYESTKINGKTYGYILGEASGPSKGTVVLVHGFPDISFGWRCQIPYLMARGYRVVAPDMLGYGGTDAPADPAEYSLKVMADDVNALARKFVGPDGQIILGGHDWGGALIWRVALWHPGLLRGVFSVCTPYNAPNAQYYELRDLVAAGVLKNFSYQLQFMGPDVEKEIQTADKTRKFLNAMYGGRTTDNEPAFDTVKGVHFDKLDRLKQSPLLSAEELDYITQRFMLHDPLPMRGPLNWYRSRLQTWKSEKPLAAKEDGIKLEMPALMITASKDGALPPSMAANMGQHFTDLSRAEVDASHWALTQAAAEVNENVGRWLGRIESGAGRASL